MTNLIPAWIGGQLEPAEKLAVHRRGLRHKAVSVFLLDGPRVLLQKRAATKYHTPGLWSNTCCTHPHWGEAAEDCALRRIKEELGITSVALTFRHRAEYRADVGGGMVEHEVVDIFTGSVTPDIDIALNPAEVSETGWADLCDLADAVRRDPGRYTPWLGIYLSEYGGMIFADGAAGEN